MFSSGQFSPFRTFLCYYSRGAVVVFQNMSSSRSMHLYRARFSAVQNVKYDHSLDYLFKSVNCYLSVSPHLTSIPWLVRSSGNKRDDAADCPPVVSGMSIRRVWDVHSSTLVVRPCFSQNWQRASHLPYPERDLLSYFMVQLTLQCDNEMQVGS